MTLGKWKLTPIYPILFVLYPLFALLGFNISEVSANVIWRPMGILLLAMILVLAALFLLMQNWHRAAIAASILTLLFFTYGHAYSYLKKIEVAGFIVGRHRQLLPLWVGLAVVGCWWTWKKLKTPQALAPTLNVIALFLLVYPTYQIASSVIHDYSIRQSASDQLQEEASHLPLGYAPDIYFIILDAYARADTLQTLFNYDNSEFIGLLQSKGFYVPECSQSNYAQTILSLSSALNLNYVDEILGEVDEDSSERSELMIKGQYSVTRKKLDSMGYNIVSFKSNFPVSEWTDADYFLEPTSYGMNDFELLLAQTSAWRIPMDFTEKSPEKGTSETYRLRTTFVLDQLQHEVLDIPSPKFVFAHILVPHRPFVFGPNGEELTPEFYDFGQMELDTYNTGYVNQVIYINKQMDRVVSTILAESSSPPIIMIMGDHGPELWSVNDERPGDDPTRYDAHRMYNFSAYYFPNGSSGLYETFTPVNAFRFVFSRYFGENYELLEDVSRYSRYKTPYQFSVIPFECDQ